MEKNRFTFSKQVSKGTHILMRDTRRYACIYKRSFNTFQRSGNIVATYRQPANQPTSQRGSHPVSSHVMYGKATNGYNNNI